MEKSEIKPGLRVRTKYHGEGAITERGLYVGIGGIEYVRVKLDSGYEDGWIPSQVTVIEDNTASKVEDPRTPETKYADEVDTLLRTYAENLNTSVTRGTMVYPYSHLGFLAEFLRDYRQIDRPDTLN